MKHLILGAFVLALFAAPRLVPVSQAADLLFQPQGVLAMEERKWDDLQRLLLSGYDVNARDTDKQTLLIVAARYNYVPAVDILLEHQARVDAVDVFGNSALIWAASQGHREIVVKLLAGKANPDMQNKQGLTALMSAARSGFAPIVELLLKAGADPSRTDYTGRDALSWAEEKKNGATIRALKAALP